MPEINKEYLEKIDFRVGKIKAVQPHPKTNDYVLLVDIGPIGADKQIVADLKESYMMDELIGKQVCVIVNTEPEAVEDVESLGLLLIAHEDKKPILIQPGKELPPGVRVCGLSNVEVTYQEG